MLGLTDGSSFPTHDLLASFLVHCKNPGRSNIRGEWEFYKPYIESLPESYSVPFFCSESEASALPKYLRLVNGRF